MKRQFFEAAIKILPYAECDYAIVIRRILIFALPLKSVPKGGDRHFQSSKHTVFLN
jgi:hypothetical protein